MSRYRRGDVVIGTVSYIDDYGILQWKQRPLVVIDVQDDSDNVIVICTSQVHKSSNYKGIVVQCDSAKAKSMNLNQDTFIYCNKTVTLLNGEIDRRIGHCSFVDEICSLLGYNSDSY